MVFSTSAPVPLAPELTSTTPSPLPVRRSSSVGTRPRSLITREDGFHRKESETPTDDRVCFGFLSHALSAESHIVQDGLITIPVHCGASRAHHGRMGRRSRLRRWAHHHRWGDQGGWGEGAGRANGSGEHNARHLQALGCLVPNQNTSLPG